MAASGSGPRSPQLSAGLASKDGTHVSIGDEIVTYIKSLPQKLKTTLMIEDVAHSCRYCRGAVVHRNEFCSQQCVVKYWERFRKENAKITGTVANLLLG